MSITTIAATAAPDTATPEALVKSVVRTPVVQDRTEVQLSDNADSGETIDRPGVE
ncbi:MAG: hypothetical protein ABIQ18_27815 [Umezawaea sp.]